jgi:uncharacterized 2Fe-2S/4Fe-4S cluster protein (DUF4445 family)
MNISVPRADMTLNTSIRAWEKHRPHARNAATANPPSSFPPSAHLSPTPVPRTAASGHAPQPQDAAAVDALANSNTRLTKALTMHELAITFQPFGRTTKVAQGTLVLEAAKQAGIRLKTPCGGGGTCGKCLIRFTKGAPDTDEFSPADDDLALGYHKACNTELHQNAIILIPDASQFEEDARVLVDPEDERAGPPSPSIRKQLHKLPAATQEDARSDLERLRDLLGTTPRLCPRALPELPTALRESDWTITAVSINGQIIGFESGDTTAANFGIAVDLGTTTVAASLHDLHTGDRLGTASAMNGQIAFGDDVLARINIAIESPEGQTKLQRTIVDTLNGLIDELIAQSQVSRHHIYHLVIAGNTTMQQLLAGIDCKPLSELPFVQAFSDAHTTPTTPLGIKLAPCAQVTLMPQIGAFVGGDTTAGLLAVAPELEPGEPFVLVDIGTNGEIVASDGEKLLAASAAAGPAFEGARISCGMRAAPGAIEAVSIEDGELVLDVIGASKPAGLCGTALIDVAATLLETGILDATGRFLDDDELPTELSASLRARITTHNDAPAFVLATVEEAAGAAPLLILQRDIRELQLASAAIRAGVSLVLQRAGLDETPTYLLAGAFGNYINPVSAIRMGLLPSVDAANVRFIGNAAHAGAQMALLQSKSLEAANRTRARAEHVSLSTDPEFQMEFAMAMMFPES